MRKDVQEKLDKLERLLTDLDSLLVGYSGGVDSTFLLAAAARALGDRAVAATATSPLYAEFELETAKQITAQLGVKHVIFASDELDVPGFAENPVDRCYHCKLSLFAELREVADAEGLRHVAHAAQVDDLSDHRPGMRAAKELQIQAPLMDAGFTKEDVRLVSREWGLPTWNKPANACMASRFPYGHRITPSRLAQIAAVENHLREVGFPQMRVRHHGEIARIEVPPADIARLAREEAREAVVEVARAAGFTWIALDLVGYRQGSMNETLDSDQHEGSSGDRSDQA